MQTAGVAVAIGARNVLFVNQALAGVLAAVPRLSWAEGQALVAGAGSGLLPGLSAGERAAVLGVGLGGLAAREKREGVEGGGKEVGAVVAS